MIVIDEPTIIELDRPRKFRIEFRELKRIENLTGHSFLYGQEGPVRPDSLEFLAISLWAGLLRDDPALTLDRVEDLLDAHMAQIREIESKVARGIQRALGKAMGQATAKAPAETPSAGSTSGQSDATTSA